MSIFTIVITFIAIAIFLIRYLLSHDKGEREPVSALWIAAFAGLAGGVAAAIIESHGIATKNLLPGAPLLPLLGSSLFVGVIEESCKFIPMAIFLYRKRYFNEHTDGIIYFALVGLGFGVPENILYTLNFGTKVGIGRIILTPIFHAATTGLVGFYFAKHKLQHQKWFRIIPILMLAMVVHGLYDFGLASGIGILILVSLIITLSVSIGLFVLFARATELDQAAGLSVVGHNQFCRTCGSPNKGHYLYCTQCGNHA